MKHNLAELIKEVRKNHKNEIPHSGFFSIASFPLYWPLKVMVYPHMLPFSAATLSPHLPVKLAFISLYLIYQRRPNRSQDNTEVGVVFTSPLLCFVLYDIVLCLRDSAQGRQTTVFVLCLHKNRVTKQKMQTGLLCFQRLYSQWLEWGAGWWENEYPNDLYSLSRFRISLPK